MKGLIKWVSILSFFVVVLASVATLMVRAIEDAEERHAVEDTIEKKQTEETSLSIDQVVFSKEHNGVVYWSDEEGQSGNSSFTFSPVTNEVQFSENEGSKAYPYTSHYDAFVEAISAHYINE